MSNQRDNLRVRKLPKAGIPWEELEQRLAHFKKDDFDWRQGRVPSYTYFFNDETMQVQAQAYTAFIGENGLGAGRAFKSLSYMLEDIYAMGLRLFNAPANAGASFTSGGTESVFMAVKTARDQALDKRSINGMKLATPLNIVAGYSAHPCLNKAAHLLGLEVKRVALDDEYRMDMAAVEEAIDDKTIMIYASAPNYPYGVFDPIPALGQLAIRHRLWLHVDGCWGGFISPFARQLGYPIPEWDLGVDGVTSLSADIHKFGYSAKGASLVLYADATVQAYEKFEFSGWPRGTYATPTFGGSTPAGAIASAWAVMAHLGEEGYLKATAETMEATTSLIRKINELPELQCLQPNGESNLFAYVSTDATVDIMALADQLETMGWFRGRLREPLAIQQGVNPAHLPVVDDYIAAVKAAILEVKGKGKRAVYDEHSY